MCGGSMRQIKRMITGLLVFCLWGCSASVKPIPKSAYAQSLTDYYAVTGLQTLDQTYFSVKVLSYIKVIDVDTSYYAYDVLIAPKTTLEITRLSVSITPDYTVHEKLEPFFTDKSGLLWKIYPVRPDDISASFRNIKPAELIKEPYGALRFRGYLVDGGKANYEALGVSERDMTLAMSRLTITIKTATVNETFTFQLGTRLSSYTMDTVPESLMKENTIVSGIVHGGLVVRWGEYLGD